MVAVSETAQCTRQDRKLCFKAKDSYRHGGKTMISVGFGLEYSGFGEIDYCLLDPWEAFI